MKLLNAAILAVALSGVGTNAISSVLYTYYGNLFTVDTVGGGATGYLTITIELPSVLGASLSNAPVNPTSYEFFDQERLLDELYPADFLNEEFQFSTNSAGAITGWNVGVSKNFGIGQPDEESIFMGSSSDGEDRSTFEVCADYDPSFGFCDSYQYLRDVYVPGNPGIWFAQEMPEVPLPAAVWMFGTGLLTLAGFARRRQDATDCIHSA